MKLNIPKNSGLTPLMKDAIRPEDTLKMVEQAIKIWKEHTHYVAEKMGSMARFATFVTTKEAEDMNNRKPGSAIKISPGQNVYNVFCFERALRFVREKKQVKT